MIDLEFDEIERAVATSVEHYCRDRCTEQVARDALREFPLKLWEGLAELGVLALGTPEGEGGPLAVCAAIEPLGRALFPGPLAATFLAGRALLDAERHEVVSGGALVSVGTSSLMPWAPLARHFIVVDRRRLYSARPRGPIEPVETVGGEPWGRVDLAKVAALGSNRGPLSIYSMVVAAYLAAAARRLLEVTCEHARTRKQFGRPIGDFQAVAHPLADCEMHLAASQTLARAAAFELEGGETSAHRTSSAARLSACKAALETAYVCHQVFGAMGVTLEGPVYPYTRRIRQLASRPPADPFAYDDVLEGLRI